MLQIDKNLIEAIGSNLKLLFGETRAKNLVLSDPGEHKQVRAKKET